MEKGRAELLGEESEEDSEEQTKEVEQVWDKIWTGKRGFRWDGPPAGPFFPYPETVVILSMPKIIVGVVCSGVSTPVMGRYIVSN